MSTRSTLYAPRRPSRYAASCLHGRGADIRANADEYVDGELNAAAPSLHALRSTLHEFCDLPRPG